MQLFQTKPHRVGVGRMAAKRTARLLTSRVLASPALRWRYGAPIADRLLFDPHDFRPGDPGRASALESGALLLGGEIADLTGEAPFDQPLLSDAARTELTGFSWLRHLEADGTVEAQAHARRLVRAWIRHTRQERLEHTPAASDACGQRMVAWLTAASFIVAGADDDIQDVMLDSLADQRLRLAAHWRAAPGPQQRLKARIAMALYDAVVGGREGRFNRSLMCLKSELVGHLPVRGGCLMRCSALLVDIAFDLLTLHHALIGSGRAADPDLRSVFLRATETLSRRRISGGELTRLQLGAPLCHADYAVLLEQASGMRGEALPAGTPPDAHHDGFVRLERGRAVVIMDVGPAPSLEFATRAAASCLAFELCDGPCRIVGSEPLGVTGISGPADRRRTRSHATLVLGGRSSGAFVDFSGAGAGFALAGPRRVRVDLLPVADGPVTVDAAHDGYGESFGYEHRRLLTLDATGTVLAGLDELIPERNRAVSDAAPFAIHFHVDAARAVAHLPAEGAIEIESPDGTWRLAVTSGARLMIEADQNAERAGAIRIVLRGAASGRTTIQWRLERIAVLDSAAPVGNDVGQEEPSREETV